MTAAAENTTNDNKDFSVKLINTLNNGTLSLMISIGHKTGLFDVLSKFSSPETPEQITKAAQLNERYVKEWLACMVVGRIIEYDSINQKYYLPARAFRVPHKALGAKQPCSLFSVYFPFGQC